MICPFSVCVCLVTKKMHILKNKHEKTTVFTQLGLIQTPSVYLLMNKERKPTMAKECSRVWSKLWFGKSFPSFFFFFFFLGLDCFCRLCVVKQEVEIFWL